MQFRITQKYASDCKIDNLSLPCDTLSPLDDWFIDMFRIHRKKIAMITHAKSTYTFFIPYAAVGGAKAIPECVSVLIEKFLYRENLSHHIDELRRLSNENPVFCKTVDRKILGHMNDFKRCASYRLEENPTDFDGAEHMIAQIPVNLQPIKYTTPLERFRELLE